MIKIYLIVKLFLHLIVIKIYDLKKVKFIELEFL